MENVDSVLLQYVKTEIAKAGQRRPLPSANLAVMPPAEKRERIATLEREAALVKQLTFNKLMAEELQSLRDLILGISPDSDFIDDDDELDATQIIAGDIQTEFDALTAGIHPHHSRLHETDEPIKEEHPISDEDSSLWRKFTDTKLKKTILIGTNIAAVMFIIGQIPSAYKSWIFPLLNYLGT